MGNCDVNCLFCKIIKENDKNKITYEDEHVVIFPDIKPASKSHFLIVSKNHIVNVKSLDRSHLCLLQHMIATAKNAFCDKDYDSSEVRLGFHWPPFTSIPHLHLHAIAPISQMNFISRIIFRENSWWFVSADYVLARLGAMKEMNLQ